MKKIIGIWFQLRSAGTDELTPYSLEKRVTTRVNQLTINIALINLFIGIPIYLFLVHYDAMLYGVLSEIALCAFPLYLNHRKHYVEARRVLYFILCAASFYFCCLLGPLPLAWLMALVMCITATWIFKKWKLRILNYGLAILVAIGVHLNRKYDIIKAIKIDKAAGDLLYLIAYGVVISLIVTTACWYGELRQFFGRRPQAQHL